MPASRERLIAANLQRQQIPRHWLIDFDQTTNEALASISRDDIVSSEIRTYAGWELEYREANDIFVDYDPATWQLRRLVLKREADFEQIRTEDAKVKPIDRSRYSLENVKKRVKYEFDEDGRARYVR